MGGGYAPRARGLFGILPVVMGVSYVLLDPSESIQALWAIVAVVNM